MTGPNVSLVAVAWPVGDRLTLGFHATDAADAIAQAKAWAHSEGVHVRTVCSARAVPESHDTWRVVLAVRPAEEVIRGA